MGTHQGSRQDIVGVVRARAYLEDLNGWSA